MACSAACSGTDGEDRDMRKCEYLEGEVTPELWDAGVRCEDGTTLIVPARLQYPCDGDEFPCDAGCTVSPPRTLPSGQCSPCGNGVCECEFGENDCNCEDCQ